MPVRTEDRCNPAQPCPICGDQGQHCFFLPGRRAVICTSTAHAHLGRPTRNGHGTYIPLRTLSDRTGPVPVPGHVSGRNGQLGPAGPLWTTSQAQPHDCDPATDPSPAHPDPSIDWSVRNQVYRALIRHLALHPDHRTHLLTERGFDARWVQAHGYRTLPHPSLRHKLVQQLAQQFSDQQLLQVPGFRAHPRYGLQLVGWPGLLIPIIGPDRSVRGCQVRCDPTHAASSAETVPRYTWLSSPPTAPSGSPIHVAFPARPGVARPVLFLTEGPLKADYLAYRSGAFCLASAGVSNWGPHLESDVRQVLTYYDRPDQVQLLIANDCQDYGWLPNGRPSPVSAATYQLAVRLLALTDRVAILIWPREWKGLDDYLRAGGRWVRPVPVLAWAQFQTGPGTLPSGPQLELGLGSKLS